jgi:hypothetical protein
MLKNDFGAMDIQDSRMSRAETEGSAGCSKRPSGKAAASEEARRKLRYVEPLSDARTPLMDFFNTLIGVQ